MSDIVIKAENLGKKYVIGHQAEKGSYLTLRDVLAQNARGLWYKTRDLVRGKPIIQGTTLEEVWALRDVSFEIRRGEAVGIIGRNGAGKSTLLKILSRITESSAWRVTITGRVASLLEVGTGFSPELTGRENIYLDGAILGMARVEIKRRFDEIVAFSELEKFLDTPVKRYSSGMYVRLAFAVAAHLEPEILLVDEVLAVGDAGFQKKCLGKMGKVAKEGRTVLFVSHNMGAISELCPCSIRLASGTLVGHGDSKEMVKNYLADDAATGEIDLSRWSLDRVLHDPPVVVHLATQNSQSQTTSQFTYAEPISFVLTLAGKTGSQFTVGLSVRNEHGALVLHLNNTDDNKDITVSNSEVEIRAVLPVNMLNNGTYYVTVWVGDTFNNLLDRVGNSLKFSIDSSSMGKISVLLAFVCLLYGRYWSKIGWNLRQTKIWPPRHYRHFVPRQT